MKHLTVTLSGLCFLLFAVYCSAEKVQITSKDNKSLLANYLPGTTELNPIIILHGFLQTNEFPTVSRLANTLNESGYSVLSPTLSLGLSNRKQSLSCEAIHTHSLISEADELTQWIEWLNNKTGKPVILIGHSAGGLVILQYMLDKNASLVQQTILISLSYYAEGPTANENSALATKAESTINEGSDKIDTYALNYCKNYPTTASNFLSYYKWNKEKTNNTVFKFRDKIAIIIGTDDKRIDSDWKQKLQLKNSNVISIDGANHFFDQTYEFDLIDAVEKLLVEKG